MYQPEQNLLVDAGLKIHESFRSCRSHFMSVLELMNTQAGNQDDVNYKAEDNQTV